MEIKSITEYILFYYSKNSIIEACKFFGTKFETMIRCIIHNEFHIEDKNNIDKIIENVCKKYELI